MSFLRYTEEKGLNILPKLQRSKLSAQRPNISKMETFISKIAFNIQDFTFLKGANPSAHSHCGDLRRFRSFKDTNLDNLQLSSSA